jgi:hypothetical protein
MMNIETPVTFCDWVLGTSDWEKMEEEERDFERGFESLEFYQDSLKLLKASYKLAGDLPKYEQYNLSSQLRRASSSILLNIAEAVRLVG